MLRAAFLLAIAVTLAAPAKADPLPDPFKLYGGEIDFSVWRKGDEIGQHRVTFTREDGALVVRSSFDIAIKLLGITVYRYDYASVETWRGGGLDGLHSTIDDNGKKTAIDAKEDDGKLVVTAPDAHEVVTGFILPSTHWNAQVIEANRVLNTLNGKVDAVKLVPVGMESVPVGGGTRQAMHYRYTGDIKAESWYDADGHWVKLRFPGTDGTLIDYVCERCTGPAGR